MTDEELQREFIRTVNNNFENLQVDNSVDEKHADIVRILNETSRAKIPTKNPSKKIQNSMIFSNNVMKHVEPMLLSSPFEL